MGLFRRAKPQDPVDDGAAPPSADESASSDAAAGRADKERAGNGAAAPADGAPAASAAGRPEDRGPWDHDEQPERGARVDLGSLWLPTVPGMELRMEIDRRTQQVTGAACVVAGSGLQLQVFAAPRTEGIWAEIRAEIAASIAEQGGSADDVPGPFGRELLTQLPVSSGDGRSGVRPARFVGVDGPRWFLRGVFSGKAAVDPQAATVLEEVFAQIVVVRDGTPRPPRELLPLHVPGAAPATPAAEAEAPALNPFSRGPEITEIR